MPTYEVILQRLTRRSLMWLVVAANIVVLLMAAFAPDWHAQLSPASIFARGGHLYWAALRKAQFPFQIDSDAIGAPTASHLTLMEDGTRLGPPHTLHAEIKLKGGGRYSHWNNGIYFSSSDGTDPRTNGRSYLATSIGGLDQRLWFALLAIDLLALVTVWLQYGRQISSIVLALGRSVDPFSSDHPLAPSAYDLPLEVQDRVRRLVTRATLGAAVAVGLLGMLTAAGAFGTLDDGIGVAKDGALVLAVLAHSALGYFLSLVMWVVGTGLARALPICPPDRLAPAALLGFMLSLPLTAVLAALSLLLPNIGYALAGMLGLLCLSSYVLRPLPLSQCAPAGWMIVLLAPPALLLGSWFGVDLHGPTDTLPGAPFGDLTFYAGMVWSLAADPAANANLGVIGESYAAYLNMLWPAVGAALIKYIPIDPILFVASAGGAAYVLNVGAALAFSFIALGKRTESWFAISLVCLAAIVAARYPSWTVESIPVIHAIPLALAATYWALRGPTTLVGRLSLTMLAVVGTGLSKIVMAGLVLPLMLTPFLTRMRWPALKDLLLPFALLVPIVCFGIWLLWKFLPFYLSVSSLGPDSVVYLLSGAKIWPTGLMLIARELALVVVALICFRVTPWPLAAVIALGILMGFADVFLFRINLIAALLIAVVLLVNSEEKARRYALPLFLALFGGLPASILTDYANSRVWIVWVVSMAAMAFTATNVAARPFAVKPLATAHLRFTCRAMAGLAVLTTIFFAAVATGHLAVSSRDRVLHSELTPAVLDIWRAVRTRTPNGALVFTDQVSAQPTLLGGWNTYAFAGQRQIYLSNIYGSLRLRSNVAAQREMLSRNREVLEGRLAPKNIRGAADFNSYFAVVDISRHVPPNWNMVYHNQDYAIYKIGER